MLFKTFYNNNSKNETTVSHIKPILEVYSYDQTMNNDSVCEYKFKTAIHTYVVSFEWTNIKDISYWEMIFGIETPDGIDTKIITNDPDNVMEILNTIFGPILNDFVKSSFKYDGYLNIILAPQNLEDEPFDLDPFKRKRGKIYVKKIQRNINIDSFWKDYNTSFKLSPFNPPSIIFSVTKKEIIKEKEIQNEHIHVPFLAGVSKDGSKIYIDSLLPKEYKTPSGKVLNVYDSIKVHETTEFSHMNKGLKYLDAHKLADKKEHEILLQKGFSKEDIQSYESWIGGEETKILKHKNGVIPNDLDTRPYEDLNKTNLLKYKNEKLNEMPIFADDNKEGTVADYSDSKQTMKLVKTDIIDNKFKYELYEKPGKLNEFKLFILNNDEVVSSISGIITKFFILNQNKDFNIPRVEYVYTNEKYRGLGLGKKLYDIIINHYGYIISDFRLTGESGYGSFQVWESLSKRYKIYSATFTTNNRQIELQPLQTIDKDSMGNFSERFIASKIDLL